MSIDVIIAASTAPPIHSLGKRQRVETFPKYQREGEKKKKEAGGFRIIRVVTALVHMDDLNPVVVKIILFRTAESGTKRREVL